MFRRVTLKILTKPISSPTWRTFTLLHCCTSNTHSMTGSRSSFPKYQTNCFTENYGNEKLKYLRSSIYSPSNTFSTSTRCCKAFNKKIENIYAIRDNIKNTKENVQKIFSPAQLVNAAPESWKPYLELARVDKPIGSWLLYIPCALSITLATPLGTLPDLYYLGLFGVGAFLMRGAGCVINDLWDKDFDKHVERTKNRPLAAGKLKPINAIGLLAVQLSLSLGILLTLNTTCIMIGVAAMIPVILYPLAKRYTYYPQAVLGLTFNIGAIMGYAAVAGSIDWSIVGPLYLGCFFWTMYYDTIYALQDIEDDVLMGVKSTAMLFSDKNSDLMKLPLSERIQETQKQRQKTENLITGFFLVTLSSWMGSFQVAGAAVCAYLVPLLQIIKQINDRTGDRHHGNESPGNLWERFVDCKKTGLYVLLGLIGGIYFGIPKELLKKSSGNKIGNEQN